MPEDAHARSIVLHQALHQLLLEEFTHGSDALPRGGCGRPLERIVFELQLLNLMQVADGRLERDEKVLGSVQLLEHAQLGERDGQVLELIGAHLWGGEGAVVSTCMLGDGDGEALELIGAHIEILERQSEAIRGNQRQSEAIRGHPRPSEAIRGHPRPSDAIRGNQRTSSFSSNSRSQSGAISAPRASQAIRDRQRPS